MALDVARIHGSVPALVTPFTDSHAVDEAAVGRLVEHVVAGGAHGFNILGTTGEFSLVPPADRRRVLRAAAATNRGRVPMIVGCGRPSLAETQDEIALAADHGADAVLVTPSYYLFLGPDEVRRQFAALAASTKLPIHFYNYPLLTKAQVDAASIARLVADGSIQGIKDSGGNAAFLARVLSLTADRPEFRVLVGGTAYFLGALALGAHGATGAIGGVAPWIELAVYDAFHAGDMARARRAQARLEAFQELFGFTAEGNAAMATKVALAALGLCGETPALPFARLSEAAARRIRDRLPEFMRRQGAAAASD
jgi:4-hydroxy-tetrahydrodipicolinate synthase